MEVPLYRLSPPLLLLRSSLIFYYLFVILKARCFGVDLFEFILSWDSVLPGVMSEWSLRLRKFSTTLSSNNFSFSSYFEIPVMQVVDI